MAKDKKKSDAGGKKDKKAKAKNPEAKAQAKAAKGAKASAKDASPVADAVRTAKRKAADLASNPAVAEVVAATLVAAAAALRNPEKARELASSAREELTAAGKAGAGQGGALWQLALDVARRSVETLGSDAGGSKAKRKRKSDQ
jgi:hypothetical protein